MNLSHIDMLAAGTAVLAVWMCGITRVRTQLWGLAGQAALLAAICVQMGREEAAGRMFILALVVFIVKAVVIPVFLGRAAGLMGIGRDRGVKSNSTLILLMGCGLLILGYFMTPAFAVPTMVNRGTAGMSLSLVFIGMLLMMTRRLALSQITGFLTMENGIFLYGLTQTSGMPLLLEMAIVFEALVGVLIAGLVIFRINRSFEHIDVTDMRGLRH